METKQNLLIELQAIQPNFIIRNNPLIEPLGFNSGDSLGTWVWNSNINKLTRRRLVDIIDMCKESWDN